MKYEVKYTWWYGIKKFKLFLFHTKKQTYTDSYESDFVFYITWFEIKISKINNYK